ncbi:uncharacterized protein B0T23DRAFT_182991 [Neurospora hispaniola]|uniref:Uncharacterized protein n=1 Tax=Neurospora hispaniola TaxID=588809 RepID=A0AAJ0MNZ5_9PEZI|nr:hypothetical protein B0T23DRAFT_182991 [Neurospora hispaniola]
MLAACLLVMVCWDTNSQRVSMIEGNLEHMTGVILRKSYPPRRAEQCPAHEIEELSFQQVVKNNMLFAANIELLNSSLLYLTRPLKEFEVTHGRNVSCSAHNRDHRKIELQTFLYIVTSTPPRSNNR